MALLGDGGSGGDNKSPPSFTLPDVVKFYTSKFADLAQMMSGAQQWAAKNDPNSPQNRFFSMLDKIGADMRAAQGAASGTDRAATKFAQDLALRQEVEGKRQFDLNFGAQKEAQAFQQKDTITQRLLEAAGLATSPAGAIQLAFMARGQGAPQAQIRNLFQSLPFLQALNKGQALPGFGLPEQLGGKGRTQGQSVGTVTGQTFGTKLPSQTAITEQAFTGLSDFEKTFLGTLYQAETGVPADQYLTNVQKSFIPTLR